MTGEELIEIFTGGEEAEQMSTYLAYQKKSVDLFSMPLDTVSDLTAITKSYRYKGMVMKVLNTDTDNVMTEYWWNGSAWKQLSSSSNLSLETDVEDSSIILTCDGIQIGNAAPLSGILEDWQWDQFISGGTLVHEGNKVYLELVYNEDAERDPIKVDVTELANGTISAVTDSDYIKIGTPIEYREEVIATTADSVTDAFNAVIDIIVDNENAISAKTEEIESNLDFVSSEVEEMDGNIAAISANTVSMRDSVDAISAATVEMKDTAIKTIENVESLEDLTPGQIVAVTAETYVYVNEDGETKLTQDRQEAIDNARTNPETGLPDITDYKAGAYVAVTESGLQKIATNEDVPEAVTYTDEEAE